MSFHNDRNTTTIASQFVKESKNKRINRLKKYRWGIGLEHEMQLFHKPLNFKRPVDVTIMLNA